MRGMASKGMFERKSGRKERGAIWKNIADNLNNYGEFGVTAQSLKNHFDYTSKKRQDVKGTGLHG